MRMKSNAQFCAGEFCVYLLMQHTHTRSEIEREGNTYKHTHTDAATAAAKMHCQKLGRSSSSCCCCCCCWFLQRGMQNSSCSSSHQILTTSCTRYAAATPPPPHTHTQRERRPINWRLFGSYFMCWKFLLRFGWVAAAVAAATSVCHFAVTPSLTAAAQLTYFCHTRSHTHTHIHRYFQITYS